MSVVLSITRNLFAMNSASHARHPGPVQILILLFMAYVFIDNESQYSCYLPRCQPCFDTYFKKILKALITIVYAY